MLLLFSMTTSEVPQALLVVSSVPGPDITPEKFNAWHDNAQTQTHLAAADVLNGRRYKAIDGRQPEWLGLYEATSPDIRPNDVASEREREVLASLDRSTYTLTSCRTQPDLPPDAFPADFLYMCNTDIASEAEDAFEEWYNGVHTDLFMKVPGWMRGRRYKLHSHQDSELVGSSGTVPHKYIALHEWTHAEFADMPEYVALANTARAEEMKKVLLRIEIRVFELQK
ncbi:hypothetical protein B0H19DRAFT_1196401 [Mycena capillaripes]|nr:hypothetical protein B0H19DRAFT_1196401 [Mycena capillaripes]